MIGNANVGPKAAQNILSGIGARDLAEAVAAGDLARLTKVPGVGKKTAERLVLELRDKMPPPGAPAAAERKPTPTRDDLLSALVHLGYSRPEAERGAERALKEGGDARFEDLLRRSLQILSGR